MLRELLNLERSIDTTKIKFNPESAEANLFTKVDTKTFLDLLYRAAHEIGLEPTIDSKKFKLTLKTPTMESTSEEEELDHIFEPKAVEFTLKFSNVEGDEGLTVARASHVSGTGYDFRKLFAKLRTEVAEIVE